MCQFTCELSVLRHMPASHHCAFQPIRQRRLNETCSLLPNSLPFLVEPHVTNNSSRSVQISTVMVGNKWSKLQDKMVQVDERVGYEHTPLCPSSNLCAFSSSTTDTDALNLIGWVNKQEEKLFEDGVTERSASTRSVCFCALCVS